MIIDLSLLPLYGEFWVKTKQSKQKNIQQQPLNKLLYTIKTKAKQTNDFQYIRHMKDSIGQPKFDWIWFPWKFLIAIKEKPMTIWNFMFKIQHSIGLNQQQKRSFNSFESHCFCFDLVVNNSPKNSITLISMIEWMLCSKDHTRNCLSTSPFFPFSSQQTLHIKYTHPIRNGLMIASHWHQLRPDKLFYFCIKLPIKFENMTS